MNSTLSVEKSPVLKNPILNPSPNGKETERLSVFDFDLTGF